MNTTDQTLDARRLICPLPILKIRRAMNAGENLQVIADWAGTASLQPLIRTADVNLFV